VFILQTTLHQNQIYILETSRNLQKTNKTL